MGKECENDAWGVYGGSVIVGEMVSNGGDRERVGSLYASTFLSEHHKVGIQDDVLVLLSPFQVFVSGSVV